jgi:hypothetical protein
MRQVSMRISCSNDNAELFVKPIMLPAMAKILSWPGLEEKVSDQFLSLKVHRVVRIRKSMGEFFRDHHTRPARLSL